MMQYKSTHTDKSFVKGKGTYMPFKHFMLSKLLTTQLARGRNLRGRPLNAPIVIRNTVNWSENQGESPCCTASYQKDCVRDA